MAVLAILKGDNGETVGQVLSVEKTFRTGSRGYFGCGKVVLNGKKHQVQVQLVEVGSKMAEEATHHEA
ncbi:MAG TPA: hypothetical protein GX513_05975 [Firmicutes bacterium]|nr:hypothetical protein [Bacillota bacterium]